MKLKKDVDQLGDSWSYECLPVSTNTNSIKVKINYLKTNKSYSIFVDRGIYVDGIYSGSIWLVKHNIPTFKQAKKDAEEYLNRVLDYKL